MSFDNSIDCSFIRGHFYNLLDFEECENFSFVELENFASKHYDLCQDCFELFNSESYIYDLLRASLKRATHEDKLPPDFINSIKLRLGFGT